VLSPTWLKAELQVEEPAHSEDWHEEEWDSEASILSPLHEPSDASSSSFSNACPESVVHPRSVPLQQCLAVSPSMGKDRDPEACEKKVGRSLLLLGRVPNGCRASSELLPDEVVEALPWPRPFSLPAMSDPHFDLE